jgi:hypothetical protein
VLPPGSRALLENGSFGTVQALTTLQASPSDPNTFTGNATAAHSESMTADEMTVLDVKVDWNIRRNTNF